VRGALFQTYLRLLGRRGRDDVVASVAGVAEEAARS
jgi:hypothetical protein